MSVGCLATTNVKRTVARAEKKSNEVLPSQHQIGQGVHQYDAYLCVDATTDRVQSAKPQGYQVASDYARPLYQSFHKNHSPVEISVDSGAEGL